MNYSIIRTTAQYPEERRRIVGAILELIPQWVKESAQLVTDIDSEIQRLKK